VVQHDTWSLGDRVYTASDSLGGRTAAKCDVYSCLVIFVLIILSLQCSGNCWMDDRKGVWPSKKP